MRSCATGKDSPTSKGKIVGILSSSFRALSAARWFLRPRRHSLATISYVVEFACSCGRRLDLALTVILSPQLGAQ